MANETFTEPVNVILSRDELLLVLSLLQAQYIPGLDVDPLGERTADQQDLSFVVAARALRARDLARVRPEDRRLVIHIGLLAAISTCAYSTSAGFAYHWPSQSELPSRIFGHVREASFVLHTPIEDVLHQFTMVASKEQLVDQIVAACRFVDTPASLSGEIRLPGSDFAQLRQLAEQGNLGQARDILVSTGGPVEVADDLLATLSSQPRVSILQTLKQVDAGTVLKRDFTVVQDANTLWLVAPAAADAEMLLVKPAQCEEVRELLMESI